MDVLHVGNREHYLDILEDNKSITWMVIMQLFANMSALALGSQVTLPIDFL